MSAQRPAVHRAKKSTTIAVSHAIVFSGFHMLARHRLYRELEANHFDEQRRDHLVGRLTRWIQRLWRINVDEVCAIDGYFGPVLVRHQTGL